MTEKSPQSPPQNPRQNSRQNPRQVALDVLNQIITAHQPLDMAFDSAPDFKSLDGRDRGFVRMMVTTILRRLGEIDAYITKTKNRPGQSLPPVLQHILRLGVAQILFLNVPDHAAVDTSVRLVLKNGLPKFKGLVNGMLRNIIRNHKKWSNEIDPVRVNIPSWLHQSLTRDYGAGRADEIAQACLQEAPLDITPKDPNHIHEISEMLHGEIMWNGSIRINAGGMVQDMEGYHDGAWWVQDISATLPVLLMGDVAGKNVIDLCAAPGGKTAQLAARGANVTALDRSAKRLSRLMENLTRLRLNGQVTTITADAGVWLPQEKADIVLLDAPCSATGTIRRNPDIIFAKSSQDSRKMMEIQRHLLTHAAKMVKPGGMLIFCTCSMDHQEGEAQSQWFLNNGQDDSVKDNGQSFRRDRISADELNGQDYLITKDGDLRALPDMIQDQGGMDGFFIARFRAH